MNYIDADSAEARALEAPRLAQFVAPPVIPTTPERELAAEARREKYSKSAAGKRAARKEKAAAEAAQAERERRILEDERFGPAERRRARYLAANPWQDFENSASDHEYPSDTRSETDGDEFDQVRLTPRSQARRQRRTELDEFYEQSAERVHLFCDQACVLLSGGAVTLVTWGKPAQRREKQWEASIINDPATDRFTDEHQYAIALSDRLYEGWDGDNLDDCIPDAVLRLGTDFGYCSKAIQFAKQLNTKIPKELPWQNLRQFYTLFGQFLQRAATVRDLERFVGDPANFEVL